MNDLMPTAASISARLRLLIEQNDITVSSAARASRLSQATFESYLYGRCLPGALALAAICNGLNCSADWLLSRPGVRHAES